MVPGDLHQAERGPPMTPHPATLTAGQLGPKHLGLPVRATTPDGQVFGRLEAVYRPRQGVRTLTLNNHRVHDVESSALVQLILDPKEQP